MAAVKSLADDIREAEGDTSEAPTSEKKRRGRKPDPNKQPKAETKSRIEATADRLTALKEKGNFKFKETRETDGYRCAVTDGKGKHAYVLVDDKGNEYLVGPTGYEKLIGEAPRPIAGTSNGKVSRTDGLKRGDPEVHAKNVARLKEEKPGPYTWSGVREAKFVCEVTGATGSKPNVILAGDGKTEILLGPTGMEKLGVSKPASEKSGGAPNPNGKRANSGVKSVGSMLDELEETGDSEKDGELNLDKMLATK